jgi:hypothetical protein
MKKLLLILGVSMLLLSACKKEATTDSGPDITTPWVGTYNVASPDGSSGITQVQIVKATNSSVKVIVRIEQFSYIYTATTLQDVTISGNTATVGETQNIIEATDLGPYAFTGNIQLNDDGTVALSTSAVSVRVPVNVEYSPMIFTFQGTKTK